MTMIHPTTLAVLRRAALLALLLSLPHNAWAQHSSHQAVGEHGNHSATHADHEDHQNHGDAAKHTDSHQGISKFAAPAKLTLDIIDAPKLEPGKAVTVRFRLRRQGDANALSFKDLKEVHTKKLHLFVVDASFTDFFHLHPQPSPQDASLFVFSFSPQKPGDYRIWADVTQQPTTISYVPLKQFVAATLPSTNPISLPIDSTPVDTVVVQELTAKLHFDTPVQAGKATDASVTFKTQDGTLVNDLQPVLGAFAHVVAYANNGQSILHSHPMGKEPKGSADRAGPQLQFHLEPGQSGFVKIFVQIRLDGRDLIFPFGVMVPDKAKD